jgi:hypothetical protein
MRGSVPRMKAWRVALCAGVVALAGCSGAHRAPHTVSMARDGLRSATLDVVNGATTVTVGTADLGGNLIRVSTPGNSGIRPSLLGPSQYGHGPVLLYLEPTGGSGPAAVRILLNPGVTWRLRFAGGASLTSVNLGHGRVSGVDFAAGTSVISMTLPRPGGTASVTLAGGASQVTMSLPAGVPARLRLDGGAASATLAGQTHTGVAGGTVLAAPGWASSAGRYDIHAPAGVSAISVAG